MPALCYFKVTSETSPLIQELAFKAGYSWSSNGDKICNIEKKYLYFWPNKTLAHSDRSDSEVEEVSFKQLLKFFDTGKVCKFTINDIKDGYRVTLRSGDKFIVVSCETKMYSGRFLVNPVKNSETFIDFTDYKEMKETKYCYAKYDIVKVEKLTHPYSLFYPYQESLIEVLWEE